MILLIMSVWLGLIAVAGMYFARKEARQKRQKRQLESHPGVVFVSKFDSGETLPTVMACASYFSSGETTSFVRK